MAELKTKQTEESVQGFLAAIQDEGKRADALTVCKLMEELSGQSPKMWGASMVGFGSYHYTYASGRSGDWFVCGFSPRKAALTLYLTGGFDQMEKHLSQLGKHTTGKGCLYVKRLADIDLEVLKAMVKETLAKSATAD